MRAARFAILPIIFAFLVVYSVPAHATFIQIENIGSVPITNIYLSFDLNPFNGSNPFYLASPGIPDPSNIYFPSDKPTSLTALQVGEHLNTYLIPELTCVAFNITGIAIDYRDPNGGMMGYSGNMNWSVTPGVTSIDWTTPYLPLAARFEFFAGGTPVPEPSTLLLLGSGLAGLGGMAWRRHRRG